VAPKTQPTASQDAQPKTRRSPAELAAEKAQKASAGAAEAKAKAEWLTIVSQLHSALGHAESRDPIATAKAIAMVSHRLQPMLPVANEHAVESTQADAS
jgi:hypothetical protein